MLLPYFNCYLDFEVLMSSAGAAFAQAGHHARTAEQQ